MASMRNLHLLLYVDDMTKTMNPPCSGEEEDHKHALEALDMLKQEISNMQKERNEVRSKQDEERQEKDEHISCEADVSYG
jgi:hypothetical protein